MFNLMAVNPLSKCLSRDLTPEYCHSLESGAVDSVPPIDVESIPGHSNRTLPRLLLDMHAE